MATQASEIGRWDFKTVDNLIGGINASVRAERLSDNECLKLENVIVKNGTIQADTGYVEFATSVVGTPQTECLFTKQDGGVETLLVTTATVYKYDYNSHEWQYITGTFQTTALGPALPLLPGTTVIPVASSAGFTVGDRIGISTSDGGQIRTTISQILSANSIVVPTDVPAGSIAVGSPIKRAVILNGDTDEQVSWTVVPSHDWLVFTNGVDIVKRYDGTDCVDVPNLPSAGNTVCKAVAVYNTALFLLNTTEGGTAYPWRVRRSDQADPTNWTTGTAGKDDLLNKPDPILCGKVLGSYLIVYRTHAIERGEFIGAGGINYFFDTMLSEEGIWSTNSVIELDDSHIIIGVENIYRYRGGRELEPLGNNILPFLYGKNANVNPGLKHKAFCVYITELTEVWVCYPSTAANEACDMVLRLDMETGAWYNRRFSRAAVPGSGFTFEVLEFYNICNFSTDKSPTWDDLEGTWNDQPWTWDSQMNNPNSNALHIIPAELNSTVFEYNYLAHLDGPSPIFYTVETKDFALPMYELRFDFIEMLIEASQGFIYVSTDRGDNWTQLGFVNSGKLQKVRFFKQLVFQTIRFRFVGTGTKFRLDWFGFSYKIESMAYYPPGGA